MSHDACTSGASRVPNSSIVAAVEDGGSYSSSRRLWSAVCDKVFERQNIALIEIHRQLCQICGHTRLARQHISRRSSAGRCLIVIHPIARTSRPVISIFPYTSRNSYPVSFSVFRMTNECYIYSNTRRQTSASQDTKVGATVWQMSQFRTRISWNSSIFAVSVPINCDLIL